MQSQLLYSRLFWPALKLAKWSKNVFGDCVCATRDPVAHYYARNCELACLAELNLAINLVKNSPIRQIKIPTKVSSYTVDPSHAGFYCARDQLTLS